MMYRYYGSVSRGNIVKKLLNRGIRRRVMIWGMGCLGAYFFPIIMSGILVLLTGVFLSRVFQSIFNLRYQKRFINNIFPFWNAGKYESLLSNLFKPLVSYIIPDTGSLAEKLYINSIKRIERAIEVNESEISYILGTRKVSFEQYESFSMIGINNLSKFSINFKMLDFYTRNEIALASSYGVMDEYDKSAVLEKILITTNDNEKIILYGDIISKKGQGKTIDAEHWTTKSLN
ncbi:hypothetical protein PNEG_03226 [Pneumocystis murina B123]|uniref:Uncharacterized protein n=1 Tax=Pneumocystis murina (strain B123) TaxID=1069680 RepID=M7PD58_PNEMU|nr:hypothetical protein PNEG_03226 [Pneumocystis murina B123]EMR08387.1 hypothetical protein PNEG_03226 [Pneumocystis murina B123]